MYTFKKTLALFIGLTTSMIVSSTEEKVEHEYFSQSSDCIRLNITNKTVGTFNLKNICSFPINLKYTLSKSQIFSVTYTTLQPNETTFSTGKKGERADFIVCQFPDVPEKIGGICIGGTRNGFTGSMVNNGKVLKNKDDEDINALLDKAQKDGDIKLNQINNLTVARLNEAQNNYGDSLSSLNNLANSMQSYANKINTYGLSSNKLELSNKSSGKTSTLDAVKNILTAYVNKQNSNNSVLESDRLGAKSISSVSTTNYKSPVLSKDIISNISCSDNYHVLDSELKPYEDQMLSSTRSSILNETFSSMIAKAKAAMSKSDALQTLEHDKNEYAQAASEAANMSSETWGGASPDLASQLDSESLPLTLNCSTTNSLPYQSICAAVANKWGSLATQLSIEVVKKCW